MGPCPRCAQGSVDEDVASLYQVYVGDYCFYECKVCVGVFVPTDELFRVSQKTEAEGGVWLTRATRSELKPERVTYVKCPSCQVLMNRINFGKNSGIIVDKCAEHGVWFDREELELAMLFVAEGGLQETRRREAEEAVNKAKNAEADARHVARKMMMKGGDSPWKMASRDVFLTYLKGWFSG